MRTFLYSIMELIASSHSHIMELNDAYEYNFSDKQLHFIIIGVIGMIGIFFFYPLFELLAKTGHVLVIAWIYVFTLIITLTFAIEIGQAYSDSGTMDFADIVSGVFGFLVMFVIFAAARAIILGLIKLIKGDDK